MIYKKIKKIKFKNKIYAIIIDSSNFKKKGVTFFTENSMNLQVGFMKHPKESNILPHKHRPIKRILYKTTEVIYVIKGELRVDFYTIKKKYLFSQRIKAKSIIILIDGAHGFKVSKDIEMIEVKQGPYKETQDKKKFDPINEKKIKYK
jgi:hypothetical protein